MNAKQRRKAYRRLQKKSGIAFFILKIDGDCVGVFEHHQRWKPQIQIDGNVKTVQYQVSEVTKPEFETFVEFGIPTLETISLFGPVVVSLT